MVHVMIYSLHRLKIIFGCQSEKEEEEEDYSICAPTSDPCDLQRQVSHIIIKPPIC